MPQVRRRVKVKPRSQPVELECKATCRLCGEVAGAENETQLLAWFPVHLRQEHEEEFTAAMVPVGNFGTMLLCRHFDTEPDWKNGPDVEAMKRVVREALEGWDFALMR